MIGGFVVGADANIARVVIRAIGPSLTRFGITHPLSDPILELHNSNGVLVTANDNWQDSQRLEVLATGLAPMDARESVTTGWFTSGAYTAVVHGKNQQTGVGLVEVYCCTLEREKSLSHLSQD